jgi:hypothetical protein
MFRRLLTRYVAFAVLLVTLGVVGVTSCSIGQEYLSGIKWSEPPVVTPGKTDADPPSDAVVLFDGKDLSAWEGGENWKIEDGVAIVQGGDITSKESFGDCQVHIEWSAPVPAEGEGQGRGNSGVFLMDRYEVQVLDSYENKTYFDGQASAIYKQTPPMVNAMRPPGEWNSYDIIWTAPKFKDDGSLESPAYVTVLHNGVLTLNHFELKGNTPFNEIPKYTAHGKAPIHLQDHGNPVRYRNIWVREIKPIVGKRERAPYFRDDMGKEWPAERTGTKVEGKVSVGGKPLERGAVAFSTDKSVRTGRVKDGNFHIDDLTAGEYVVTIHYDDDNPENSGPVPARFGDAEKSGLKFTLADGKNACNLDLPSE